MHFGEACGSPPRDQFFSKQLNVKHNERKCEAAVRKGHEAGLEKARMVYSECVCVCVYAHILKLKVTKDGPSEFWVASLAQAVFHMVNSRLLAVG